MRLFTLDAVVRAFPSAEGLPPQDLQQAALDAQQLYDVLQRDPGQTEARARNALEGEGVEADRFNRAIALLRDSGLVVALPEAPPSMQPPEAAPEGSPRRRSQRRRSTKK